MEELDIIERIPTEKMPGELFQKILSSDLACRKLSEAFYSHIDEDNLVSDVNPVHFAKVLFSSYQNGDVSGVLLEICQRSMFDLLREAYLIPRRFHGKAGRNPQLLTTPEGELNGHGEKKVSEREFKKFREIYDTHQLIERSKIYLADGYDIERSYTDGLRIEEQLVDRRRGIMILYALPDTEKAGLTEAQTYALIWNTFNSLQYKVPRSMVFYGQETGENGNDSKDTNDEIGILLPLNNFEKNIIRSLDVIDKEIILCREDMMQAIRREQNK
ncbi:MAG: DUF4866 family protein [Candidatus Weimeria sp.]